MGKRIVILNGSPRRTGNTSLLAKAFREGAESAGHEVKDFFLAGMDIHPCRSCWGDGMDEIYPAYREADVVVLASPVYYWAISGTLKTAFDRLFAVAECNPDYANPVKDTVLLMAAEGHEFTDPETWYDRLEAHIGWRSLGKVLCGGVVKPGDIAGRKELEDARALGASL